MNMQTEKSKDDYSRNFKFYVLFCFPFTIHTTDFVV